MNISRAHSIVCLIFILLVIACSSEKSESQSGLSKPTGSAAGSLYSIELIPTNASRDSVISIVTHGFHLPEAKVEWFVNGIQTDTSSPEQFKASGMKKGDKIQARAVIKGNEIMSNIIQIGNSLPQIDSVKLLPEVVKPGDTLYVEASGSDRDGDDVNLFYEWTKNGESVSTTKQIGVPLKRGDKISVKITPYDGENYGNPVILHREITNFPPSIIENNKHNFDGNTYTYQVKATDPDGDTLTYAMKAGPRGMTIDPASGLIKWNVPSNFTGKTSFTISVTDGHGGEVSQVLTLDIKPEQKK